MKQIFLTLGKTSGKRYSLVHFLASNTQYQFMINKIGLLISSSGDKMSRVVNIIVVNFMPAISGLLSCANILDMSCTNHQMLMHREQKRNS